MQKSLQEDVLIEVFTKVLIYNGLAYLNFKPTSLAQGRSCGNII